MTNWLTARYPERFKAAVTDRSICNWLSFFGASDIGPRFTYLELKAKPWERSEVLWEKSPSASSTGSGPPPSWSTRKRTTVAP